MGLDIGINQKAFIELFGERADAALKVLSDNLNRDFLYIHVLVRFEQYSSIEGLTGEWMIDEYGDVAEILDEAVRNVAVSSFAFPESEIPRNFMAATTKHLVKTPAELLVAVRAYAGPFYNETTRVYHGIKHIQNMLRALIGCNAHTPELGLAVWGHDLIYDARAKDNEERSAEAFDCWLRENGADEGLRATVRRLILATKHTAPPTQRDEALLVDADLSILGASPAEFDAYNAAIRQEYAHVPALLYGIGRRKVLRGFLERERIFTTPEFAKLETQARENLRRVLH